MTVGVSNGTAARVADTVETCTAAALGCALCGEDGCVSCPLGYQLTKVLLSLLPFSLASWCSITLLMLLLLLLLLLLLVLLDVGFSQEEGAPANCRQRCKGGEDPACTQCSSRFGVYQCQNCLLGYTQVRSVGDVCGSRSWDMHIAHV